MWRKVLQACNLTKKVALVFATLCFSVMLSAQELEMPSMPEMPEMPSTSLNGTFYTPSFPTKMMNNKKKTTKNETSKTETVLTDGTSTNDVLTSLLGNSSTLTASDISTLYDSGLFSNISSLDSTSALSSYSTASTTNILLQQVLNSLNDLKTEQKNVSPAEKNVLEKTKTDSENFKTREPSILRFKINGYNISDSLTKVFFSEPEADGTFLLTADRKYYANQKAMTETFYMLFKTVSTKGSTVSYKVQPTIVQDQKNDNSYVYKLMSVKDLVAEKTGNLVVIHYNADNLNADMLLDIDKK